MSHENPQFNYTGHATEGESYQLTKDLSTTAIAAIIRRQLKAAFPTLKFSVRSQYFSGGSSIHVNITHIDFPLNTKLYQRYLETVPKFEKRFDEWRNGQALSAEELAELKPMWNTSEYRRCEYSMQAIDTRKAVQKIVDRYNFDDSDGQIDYFHTNYYSHVEYLLK